MQLHETILLDNLYSCQDLLEYYICHHHKFYKLYLLLCYTSQPVTESQQRENVSE